MRDRQDAGRARFHLSPSAWPLYLGKYTSLNARWTEPCLLANKPWELSGIFRDAARKIDCRSWVGVHSPGAFFTVPANSLASLYTPAHLTGRNTQMSFTYSSVSLHKHMQIQMHGHRLTQLTLKPIFMIMNWLLLMCMISIPLLDPISMLMKLNLQYKCIKAYW